MTALATGDRWPVGGEPAWFVRGTRMVVCLDDHHHGVDHLAFWCAAPPGAQEELLAVDPVRFFRPPYVGAKGWLGVRIDLGEARTDWSEIAEICTDAYRQVAPKKLVALLDDVPEGARPPSR